MTNPLSVNALKLPLVVPAPVQFTLTNNADVLQEAAAGFANELTLNCEDGEVALPILTPPAEEA